MGKLDMPANGPLNAKKVPGFEGNRAKAEPGRALKNGTHPTCEGVIGACGTMNRSEAFEQDLRGGKYEHVRSAIHQVLLDDPRFGRRPDWQNEASMMLNQILDVFSEETARGKAGDTLCLLARDASCNILAKLLMAGAFDEEKGKALVMKAMTAFGQAARIEPVSGELARAVTEVLFVTGIFLRARIQMNDGSTFGHPPLDSAYHEPIYYHGSNEREEKEISEVRQKLVNDALDTFMKAAGGNTVVLSNILRCAENTTMILTPYEEQGHVRSQTGEVKGWICDALREAAV